MDKTHNVLYTIMKYHSALKKMETLTYATTWANLENIVLCEIISSQKDKCKIPLK